MHLRPTFHFAIYHIDVGHARCGQWDDIWKPLCFDHDMAKQNRQNKTLRKRDEMRLSTLLATELFGSCLQQRILDFVSQGDGIFVLRKHDCMHEYLIMCSMMGTGFGLWMMCGHGD